MHEIGDGEARAEGERGREKFKQRRRQGGRARVCGIRARARVSEGEWIDREEKRRRVAKTSELEPCSVEERER
eukprot:2862120-Pleurochrysis_carterae.AAC.1